MPTDSKSLRLLVVRLGAMGDILHTLPAVTELRSAHPDWRIGWAIEPHWAPLVVSDSSETPAPHDDLATPQRQDISHTTLQPDPRRPVVDRVHLVSAKKWGRSPLQSKTWADIARVRRELCAAHYDVCVDFQGAIRSAVVGRFAAAPRMIGEDNPRERPARFFFSERIKTTGRHVIEQCLEVASAITAEHLPFKPAELPRDPLAEAWCDTWLRNNFGGRPFVLLNPGAGWGAKRWPVERYGKVAASLAGMGYGVAVNAGPAEADLAAAVVASAASANITSCVACPSVAATSPSLPQLISLSRRASMMIAGDTGPLHLANALGRPVVGIFGPTDPARNGPFGSAFRVLRHPDSRRDHTRRSDPEAGLLTISVDEVMAAASELLNDGRFNTEASPASTSQASTSEGPI